jgi:hypothetical protein
MLNSCKYNHISFRSSACAAQLVEQYTGRRSLLIYGSWTVRRAVRIPAGSLEKKANLKTTDLPFFIDRQITNFTRDFPFFYIGLGAYSD